MKKKTKSAKKGHVLSKEAQALIAKLNAFVLKEVTKMDKKISKGEK